MSPPTNNFKAPSASLPRSSSNVTCPIGEPLDHTLYSGFATPAAWKNLETAFGSSAETRSKLIAIKRHLCVLFYPASNGGTKKALNVSPIASGVPNARGLKMRWMLPGHGKSGGLRLGVLVFCEAREIHVKLAEVRKGEPSDREFESAFVKQSAVASF